MHRISSITKPDDQAYRGHVINRYLECFPREKPNGFDDHVSRLFEFYIVDSAYQQWGMTDHYNETVFQAIIEAANKKVKKGGVSYSLPLTRQDPVALSPEWKQAEEDVFSKNEYLRRYIEHINDLFGLKPRLNNKESYVEDLSVHYGLRLLRKIVSVNGGYLRGLSPCGADKTQFYYNGQTDENDGSSYVTLWSALLPLEYSWKGWSREGKDEVPIETLDDPTVTPRDYLIHLNAHTLSARKETSISNQSWTKTDEIKTYRQSLAKYLNVQNQDLSKAVLVLEAGETLDELEILVKSLFGQLVDLLFEDNEKFALRIAIILPNLSRVYEFVRLFSILYYDGRLSIMRCVQIALCVKSDHPIEPLYVGCMLAQEHLSTTYEIARRFIYHYPEHTLCTLPILSYLIPQANKAGDSSDSISDVSLFPFDLFLSKEMPISTNLDMIRKDWKENIFLDRIERILSTEIEKTSYGCMIRDTHVRLGSKIHLDRFYEAELLFHNTGNIARFAYMLVQDLLHGPNKLAQNEPVLLLGYEKYSAPLMMQIKRWLDDAKIFGVVFTAIIHDFGERKKEVRFHLLSQESRNKKEIKSEIEDIEVANKLKESINKYLAPFFQKAEEFIDKAEGKMDNPLEEEHKYKKRQGFLQKLSDVTLQDVLSASHEDKVFEEAVVELVRKYLVEPRDYMRLYSMETAYEALEDKTRPETCEQTILKLIDQKLSSFNPEKEFPPGFGSEQAKRLCFVYNAEWLISYIKVLSRAQLSNHYVYRQAIVGIPDCSCIFRNLQRYRVYC